jgi:hypothetical protein
MLAYFNNGWRAIERADQGQVGIMLAYFNNGWRAIERADQGQGGHYQPRAIARQE